MEKTDAYMLNRIMWKAGKHGIYKRSNTYTLFFDELSGPMKAYLRSNINEEFSGGPVIFFTKPTNQWTLLCTKRVIGYAGEKVFSISFQDISKIKTHPLQITKKNKLEWDELTILDKQNNEYTFHTYNGYTHNLLHNVLLMCWRLAY